MSKTCTEINASLARSKRYWSIGGLWFPPGADTRSDSIGKEPPDFCGDSKYMGELLKELIEAGKDITLRLGLDTTNEGAFVFHCSELDLYVDGNSPIEAVARAAEAMIEAQRAENEPKTEHP